MLAIVALHARDGVGLLYGHTPSALESSEFDHATTFLQIVNPIAGPRGLGGTTQPLRNCAARLLLQGGQLEHHNCVHGFR